MNMADYKQIIVNSDVQYIRDRCPPTISSVSGSGLVLWYVTCAVKVHEINNKAHNPNTVNALIAIGVSVIVFLMILTFVYIG